MVIPYVKDFQIGSSPCFSGRQSNHLNITVFFRGFQPGWDVSPTVLQWGRALWVSLSVCMQSSGGACWDCSSWKCWWIGGWKPRRKEDQENLNWWVWGNCCLLLLWESWRCSSWWGWVPGETGEGEEEADTVPECRNKISTIIRDA